MNFYRDYGLEWIVRTALIIPHLRLQWNFFILLLFPVFFHSPSPVPSPSHLQIVSRLSLVPCVCAFHHSCTLLEGGGGDVLILCVFFFKKSVHPVRFSRVTPSARLDLFFSVIFKPKVKKSTRISLSRALASSRPLQLFTCWQTNHFLFFYWNARDWSFGEEWTRVASMKQKTHSANDINQQRLWF